MTTSRIITTTVGDINVTLQGDDTAYVRAGTEDRSHSSADADTLPGITLPRASGLASLRAHFRRGPEGWAPVKPASTYVTICRADGSDATQKQAAAACEAIAEALGEQLDTEELDASQYLKNLSQATDRRKVAAELLRAAEALQRQATELEMDRGARVVYMDGSLGSGMTERVQMVRTSAGELLGVPEAETSSYGTRWLGRFSELRERD